MPVISGANGGQHITQIYVDYEAMMANSIDIGYRDVLGNNI
jgi:hypothetical protein